MLPESCPIKWSTAWGTRIGQNASDSIAWSLSKTACMDVTATRSVFIGQVR